MTSEDPGDSPCLPVSSEEVLCARPSSGPLSRMGLILGPPANGISPSRF